MPRHFYEDELEYYLDTALDLITAVWREGGFQVNGILLSIEALMKRIENKSISAKELAEFSYSQFMELTIETAIKSARNFELNFFKSPISEEALTKVLDQLRADLVRELTENKVLSALFDDLQCLGSASMNKETYLRENKLLLSQNEAQHKGNCYGQSRLIKAIKRRDTDRALDFISRGLYLEQLDHGEAPLMYAAEAGLDSIVEALIPFSKLEAKNSCGQTALLRAILRGHQSTVTLLLSAGARVESVKCCKFEMTY